MVLILGASCLHRVVSGTPHRILRDCDILGRTHARPSLSLNHNCAANLNVQNLLEHPNFIHRRDIILWHDIVSNSITPHKSNNNTPLTVTELQNILTKHKKQIKAIIYSQRFGTPDLFTTLRNLNITTIISIKRHLISKRKQKSNYFLQQLQEIHPSTRIEFNVLKTIIRRRTSLRQLLSKKRSKTRKRNGKNQNKKLNAFLKKARNNSNCK